jgi:hypothetical protein
MMHQATWVMPVSFGVFFNVNFRNTIYKCVFFYQCIYIPHIRWSILFNKNILCEMFSTGWLYSVFNIVTAASFFFICVYFQHDSRIYGMAHLAYPRTYFMACRCFEHFSLWFITAFLGYGVTLWVKCHFGVLLVITNLLSIIPIYGDAIVTLDLGWSSVGQAYF